jgi:hypothetical protein
MIKTSWIYILFYIKLALIANLVLYIVVALVDAFVTGTYIFKPFVRYTFGLLQPLMVVPVITFEAVNLRPFQWIYLIIIVLIFVIEGLIILLWVIALAIRPILFGKNFLAGVPPFEELERDGAFEWFFEKAEADVKIKEIAFYILSLLREILSPEEFAAAEQRCREMFDSSGSSDSRRVGVETFVGGSGGNVITSMRGFTPIPPKEHIDYDYEKIYETDDKKDDRFYRGSYASIRHRDDANRYKNMVIARPDTPSFPELPDVKNKIVSEMNYLNIKLK